MHFCPHPRFVGAIQGHGDFRPIQVAPTAGPLGRKGCKIMPLTDVAIRNAKPRAKPYKMGDSLGLFLLVQPTGGKLWRVKYRLHGKEGKLAIGTYPAVGLADARRKRDEARDLVSAGKNPAIEKRRAKAQARYQAGVTFTAIAAEFCEKRKKDGGNGWARATATRSEYLLSLLKGSIGNMPVTDIEPIDILSAVRRIERRGKLESARRTLQLASAVFRYAVATARLKSDPTRDLRGALLTPTVTHYGAIIEPTQVGKLLHAIDGYDGQPLTKFALRLAPHVFVRPGELRHAEWTEFDLDGALWTKLDDPQREPCASTSARPHQAIAKSPAPSKRRSRQDQHG